MSDPGLYHRNCRDCALFEFHEDGKHRNTPVPNRFGKAKRRAGPPPCGTKKGCDKGSFVDPKVLTRQQMAAYSHYRECCAVGIFPDDPIVRENAALFRAVEEIISKHEKLTQQGDLARLLLVASGGSYA